jgi:RND family efflux transporter MFP subunit
MRRWMVLVLLVVIAGTVLGRFVLGRLAGQDVTVVSVTRGRVVAAVYATGRVDTEARATVRTRVTAPLATLLVGPGQPVAAGEEVARLDGVVLRLAIDRAVLEAEAARAGAASAADAAARAERLFRDGLLSEDAWVRARETARETNATVAARESAVALAREQASWGVLRAPLGGVVSAILHRAGDALREGDEVLTIVDLGPAYVRVAVDERDVGRVAVGEPVRMVFDAYPGRVLEGDVWRIVPAVDRLTKSSDVLVQLPANRPPLQLDLTATVNIITGVIEDALVIPREGLEGAGETRAAFVVSGEHRAIRRAVRVGACDETRCQVLSGLSAGEQVIAPLPAGLKPGAKVSAIRS